MTEVWKKLNVVFVEGLSDTGDPGIFKILPLSPEAIYRLGDSKEGN
jgi:hypothetical protein